MCTVGVCASVSTEFRVAFHPSNQFVEDFSLGIPVMQTRFHEVLPIGWNHLVIRAVFAHLNGETTRSPLAG